MKVLGYGFRNKIRFFDLPYLDLLPISKMRYVARACTVMVYFKRYI